MLLAGSLYNQFADPNLVSKPVIGLENKVISDGLPFSKTILLLSVVFFTCLFVAINRMDVITNRLMAWIGKMSYSIFIWHQVILAFYRYTISDEVTISFTVCYLLFTFMLSVISYYLIEQKTRVSHKTLFSYCLLTIFIFVPSGWVYVHGGVVRDIPELGIAKNNVHKGMFAEYCDRIYNYDKDFDDNKNIKVLILGNSYGRDMANVLLESDIKDRINLSYVFSWEKNNYINRIKRADAIFIFCSKDDVPSFIKENIKSTTRLFGIGTKNFGACEGVAFVYRNDKDYFVKTIKPVKGYFELNKEWKNSWGDNYIDFMAPVDNGDGTVSIFTPDHHFISADGGHLTQFGAKWYASIFDFNKLLGINK